MQDLLKYTIPLPDYHRLVHIDSQLANPIWLVFYTESLPPFVVCVVVCKEQQEEINQ